MTEILNDCFNELLLTERDIKEIEEKIRIIKWRHSFKWNPLQTDKFKE